MNKRKEILLKILIVSSIYTTILGISTFMHKDNNFNEDKFKCDKKAKVVKLVKKDSFSVFMNKVRQGEIKRIAERKAKIEKQKQIELKRVLLEKKKAREKAEKVRLEKIRVERIKEEKRIAKKKKASQESKNISPSRGGNYNSNYNTTFTLSFYDSLNGDITSSGSKAKNGMCASNVIKQGTNIQLEGYGTQRVMDSGGSNFNSSNRLDIFVERLSGESDSEYSNRVCRMGMVTVRGRIIN